MNDKEATFLFLLASAYLYLNANTSAQNLDRIKEELAFAPLDVAATYADHVCKEYITDQEFLNSTFDDFDPADHIQFLFFNATSVGNLAYIALHAPDAKIRGKARDMMEGYRLFLNRAKSDG